MCYFPENIPPPTAQLARCRLILQGIAACFFILSLFAIIAGNFFFLFYALLLTYLLYISWATFNYLLTLYFFFITIIETTVCYIQIIGLIQYYEMIQSTMATHILFLVAKMAFFPTAVFFSHYSYKYFKQFSLQSRGTQNSFEMMPMSGMQSYNSNRSQGYQPPSVRDDVNIPRGFMAFQGTGTQIG